MFVCRFYDKPCDILRPYLRDRYRKQKNKHHKIYKNKGDNKNEEY
jgi:hypothetical protein